MSQEVRKWMLACLAANLTTGLLIAQGNYYAVVVPVVSDIFSALSQKQRTKKKEKKVNVHSIMKMVETFHYTMI